jgi:hypothetical protein
MFSIPGSLSCSMPDHGLKLPSRACSIGVFANTTSPCHGQLTDIPYPTLIESISKYYYSSYTPNCICPRPLVLSVVHINHLRSSLGHSGSFTPTKLLHDINVFSPAEWACSIGTGAEELQSLGLIYQSAVALYCILSLQSVSLLDETEELELERASHYERLLLLLRAAFLSPRLKMAVFWPFCVAGVAGVSGSAADRAFINEKLLHMNRSIGQPTPMILRGVLQRFWCSDSKCWDGCFDRRYCFIG